METKIEVSRCVVFVRSCFFGLQFEARQNVEKNNWRSHPEEFFVTGIHGGQAHVVRFSHRAQWPNAPKSALVWVIWCCGKSGHIGTTTTHLTPQHPLSNGGEFSADLSGPHAEFSANEQESLELNLPVVNYWIWLLFSEGYFALVSSWPQPAQINRRSCARFTVVCVSFLRGTE